jgi:hypothetical protein
VIDHKEPLWWFFMIDHSSYPADLFVVVRKKIGVRGTQKGDTYPFFFRVCGGSRGHLCTYLGAGMSSATTTNKSLERTSLHPK